MFLFMRIWCSNYRSMQYWLSSNDVLIIIPSYDVHHVQESQSDCMGHQWFQNTIVIDIIKMTFLCIISHNIYYYYNKKTWFPFILMLSDRNKMRSKYQQSRAHLRECNKMSSCYEGNIQMVKSVRLSFNYIG